MSTLWDRRYQRVEFRAPVQVARTDANDSVMATALNLSEAGIFVAAPEPPGVGTELVCAVPLFGQLRPLRGRVAWVRRWPRGMGIEFIDLSQDDARVLRQVVGTDEDHPIKVWFDGLRDPVGAKAVLTTEGIRLRATLPFLRVHSTVRFAPADRLEEQHLGMLNQVRLESAPGKAAVIVVEVGLTPPARGRVAKTGEGWAPTDTVSGETGGQPIMTGEIPAVPPRRLAWASRWVALGLLLGLLTLTALEIWARTRVTLPLLRGTAPVPVPVLVSEPAPAPAPEPEPAPEPTPLPPPPRRLPVAAPGRLVVPVDGTLEGLERVRLADPPGLVLTLPNATTPLAAGQHPIGQHGFRLITVFVRAEGGIKLRVYFSEDPPGTASVDLTPEGLTVETAR